MGAGRAPGEQWEEDLRDLGGSFLVSEESGRLDDVEACIGEVGDHVVRPLDGEETVLFAPDELDGNVDSVVEVAQFSYVSVLEAAQHADGGVSMRTRLVEGLEEKLVELAIDGCSTVPRCRYCSH